MKSSLCLKPSLYAVLLASLTFMACGQYKPESVAAEARQVIVELRSDESLCIQDVRSGALDMLYAGVAPSALGEVGAAANQTIMTGDASYLSYSLLLNPAPDSAPYLSRGGDGIERFNPLGIAKLRRALNRLIDRVSLARELATGHATPLLLPFSPDAPGAAPWYRAAYAEGYSEKGDNTARQDIQEALSEAAALPALAGRLRLVGGYWLFDGTPVSLRVLARADDPSGALAVAAYVSTILQDLGIKTELLEKNRSACVEILSGSDPADLAWHIYTERWGSGGAVAYRDPIMCQMYSLRYGAFFPVASRVLDPWMPSSPEADRFIDRLWEGEYESKDSYENDIKAMTRAGLNDSFRIFLALTDRSYLFNRKSFISLPALDSEAGLNAWFWRSALRSKAADSGAPLRIGVLSRSGSIFEAAWNPIYKWNLFTSISWPVLDASVEPDAWDICEPSSGKPAWLGVRLLDLSSAPAPVPPQALAWHAGERRWKEVGHGLVASARAELDYSGLHWHTGTRGSAADALFWLAFRLDWTRDDGEGDRRFDLDLMEMHGYDLEHIMAVEPLGDGRLAVYADWGWGIEPERQAQLCSLSTPMVHWSIVAAMEELLLGGPESRYAWTSSDSKNAIDLLRPECVADLSEALARLYDSAEAPAYLRPLISAEEARRAYGEAQAFLGERGHAWASNGPYLVAGLSFSPPYIALERYSGYRASNADTLARISYRRLRFDELRVPTHYTPGESLRVYAKLSAAAWPDGTDALPDSGARVSVSLYADGFALSKNAALSGQGVIELTFNSAELAGIKAGRVNVMAEARTGDNLPVLTHTSFTVER
jgi:peptide/nickel transport system substrate-binding protein